MSLKYSLLIMILFVCQNVNAYQPTPEHLKEMCKSYTFKIANHEYSFCDSLETFHNTSFETFDNDKYLFLKIEDSTSCYLLTFANQRRWGFYALLGIINYSNYINLDSNTIEKGDGLVFDSANTMLSFVDIPSNLISLRERYKYTHAIIRKNVDYSNYAKETWYEFSNYSESLDSILDETLNINEKTP